MEYFKQSVFTNHFINLTFNKNEAIFKSNRSKAQAQFHHGADMEKQVDVAKFFNPTGSGS